MTTSRFFKTRGRRMYAVLSANRVIIYLTEKNIYGKITGTPVVVYRFMDNDNDENRMRQAIKSYRQDRPTGPRPIGSLGNRWNVRCIDVYTVTLD